MIVLPSIVRIPLINQRLEISPEVKAIMVRIFPTSMAFLLVRFLFTHLHLFVKRTFEFSCLRDLQH